MAIKRSLLLALLGIALAACSETDTGTGSDSDTGTGAETTQAVPAPIQALKQRGLKIVGTFEAPGGLTGYAGVSRHRPIAIYVTEDGQYAIVGSLINAQGQLVNRDTLRQLVAEPMSKQAWAQLQDSTWVPDGDADAPRTVYVFSDANCPYCHMFWKRAQPWVESGKVQLRHILVGVIGKTSDNKAASILGAENPEQAYIKNQQHFREGGIKPMEDIPAEIRKKLAANFQLMRKLGLRGTPAIIYRDEQGHVQFVRGVPPKQAMEKILGPR